MNKPAKLIWSKTLSSLEGMKKVSIGDATVERRADRDFSKKGIPAYDSKTFDDYNEEQERWGSRP